MRKKINQKVSVYINHLLSESHKKTLEELDTTTLLKLRSAYELVNEHEEVENVNRVLQSTSIKYNRDLQFNPA